MQVGSLDEWRARLHIIEQIRVITDLLQLHQHIQQPDLLRTRAINHLNIPSKNTLISLLLQF